MQDRFSIFLPALVGLAVLFVFALFRRDRSDQDPTGLDPAKTAVESPPAAAGKRSH